MSQFQQQALAAVFLGGKAEQDGHPRAPGLLQLTTAGGGRGRRFIGRSIVADAMHVDEDLRRVLFQQRCR